MNSWNLAYRGIRFDEEDERTDSSCCRSSKESIKRANVRTEFLHTEFYDNHEDRSISSCLKYQLNSVNLRLSVSHVDTIYIHPNSMVSDSVSAVEIYAYDNREADQTQILLSFPLKDFSSCQLQTDINRGL